MCLGEATLDTIGPREQEQLRMAATAGLPTHRFDVRANAEGTSWIVLEPPTARDHALRFTICRITPCVILMVEAASGRRHFQSFADIDGVVAFARSATDMTALAGAHNGPAGLQ